MVSGYLFPGLTACPDLTGSPPPRDPPTGWVPRSVEPPPLARELTVDFCSQTRSLRSSGLHSLAFVFGTFAYAKDQASLPHDGLL